MRQRIQPRKRDIILSNHDIIPTNQPSSDPSTCIGNSGLGRPLAQSSLLHELFIKTMPKHSLSSWLCNGINAQIYMNEVCTLINYTQSTIHTQSRVPYSTPHGILCNHGSHLILNWMHFHTGCNLLSALTWDNLLFILMLS